jgi:uncharacterized cupin superfamily protein
VEVTLESIPMGRESDWQGHPALSHLKTQVETARLPRRGTLYPRSVVPEATLEQTDVGLVAKSDGWFVVNAKNARWFYADGRPALCELEGDVEFSQLGIYIVVLWPGQPMAMYHWEVDQEDFLVVSGEALLLVEGEERPLRQWDFVHCSSRTSHVIIGAGEGPCVVVAVGARAHQEGPDWGGYPVEEVALKHGAGVEQETNDPDVAYASVTPSRENTRYRDGWLSG